MTRFRSRSDIERRRITVRVGGDLSAMTYTVQTDTEQGSHGQKERVHGQPQSADSRTDTATHHPDSVQR
jgi:hypothetical protein